jgi:hypothetical protein
MWYSNLEKTFISQHILHQHWHTCPIALPVRRNLQHRNLLTVVSATSTPPFQPLRHQWNVCHPVVNRFMQQTLPNINRKHLFMNILCSESFWPQKTQNKTLLFGNTLLKHNRHFDYWNQPLNMRICYLDCHEAGLCCYLVTHMQNLLHPLHCFTSIWDLFTDYPSYNIFIYTTGIDRIILSWISMNYVKT